MVDSIALDHILCSVRGRCLRKYRFQLNICSSIRTCLTVRSTSHLVVLIAALSAESTYRAYFFFNSVYYCFLCCMFRMFDGTVS